jgi:pimeloyl-ACP methyl ester carboxylesterase
MMKTMPIAIAAFVALSALTPVVAQSAAKTAAASLPAKEGMVKLAESNIQYISRGKGETIVVLPGGVLTVAYLDGLAEALARAGYRVVGVNFRGSGKSTGSSDGVTLQTMADDVVGVIKALDVGPVHVMGNDFGNRVARMVAKSNPELTRSVILLAAGGKVPLKPDAQRALLTFFTPKSTDAEILAVMNFFVANPADAKRVWSIVKPSRAPGAAAAEKNAAEATPLDAWWAPPGKTRYLILQGANDQIAPPENGEILKKDLGERATLVNVPGAAHLLPVEQPDVTAKHVIDFLRQLPGK